MGTMRNVITNKARWNQLGTKKENSMTILLRLLTYLKPLRFAMAFAILFGTLGHLSATMIPYLTIKIAIEKSFTRRVFVLLALLGVLRAILRYLEQLLNHYIAFKILAEIRHHVFDQLQKLAPSKLEEKQQGDLIAMITSDIELIEVFYAHTISPVFIFVAYMSVILYLQYKVSFLTFLLTLLAHCFVVYMIPKFSNRKSKNTGEAVRMQTGELSASMLSSIFGIFSISQFQMKEQSHSLLARQAEQLSTQQFELRKNYAVNQSLVDGLIYSFALLLMVLTRGVPITARLLSLVLYLSSFGPSIALANLGFDLQETLASAKRIITLLDEKPQIKEVENPVSISSFESLHFNHVSFAYEQSQDKILKNIDFNLSRHEVVGIEGKSGSGKSTILKLIMRFWDVDEGFVHINNHDIKNLSLNDLRGLMSYMSQDAILFQDTIAYNISFNDPRFTQADIELAAKKAAIHDFIMSKEYGYQTKLSELGDSLSMGEKQRITLARMFLFDRDVMLFDEPSSNLDHYNESLILKSIVEHCQDKTVIIVSHRASTLRICDRIVRLEEGSLRDV